MTAIFSWVGLAEALVKLALLLFNWQRDKGLIKMGEDKANARAVLLLSQADAYDKELTERFARMTPEELKKEIEKQGDYRD